MSGSDRRRVEDVCHAALDRAGADRTAFVTAACGDDLALRREVEAMLAHAHTAENFMDAPAGALASRGSDGRGASLIARRIGVYEIVSLLGAGGMGEVYRARDTRLKRDVAIKVLPAVFTADPARVARFDREARMLAALNHAHIGAIYGVEHIDGTTALVLELVEGETLADRIAVRGRGLAVGDALAIARQVAEALDAAHERGIIHRDLKPANIKITPAGVVKVLDFGLATTRTTGARPGPAESSTIAITGMSDGVLLGTLAYMSPEQLLGQAADRRADIWAFGCVLYEMLTGQLAFPSATVSDHVVTILERGPDWRALPAATPPRIHRLLRRCLETDVARRFRDAADVRIELDDSREDFATPQARIRAGYFWALGMVMSALVGGLALWMVKGPRRPKRDRSRSR